MGDLSCAGRHAWFPFISLSPSSRPSTSASPQPPDLPSAEMLINTRYLYRAGVASAISLIVAAFVLSNPGAR